MTLIAGIISRNDQSPPDSACVSLRQLISRDSSHTVSTFRDSRSCFLKVDVGVYEETAIKADENGALTLLAGEALLGLDSETTNRSREKDIASIHYGFVKGDRTVLERARGVFCAVHYHDFLTNSIQSLAQNMAASDRLYPYSFLATLSSGYDSATVTAFARDVGCREAICVDRARGDYDDSGVPLAAKLGVAPLIIGRDDWRSTELPEVPFISADAKGEDVFFKGSESFLAGRVLLTGISAALPRRPEHRRMVG